MWCDLDQRGSCVSAVNRPCATERRRRNTPRVLFSKRASSLSSSTRSKPDTTTIGLPIMSSQKMGPSSRVSFIMSCTGASARTDSMLPSMNRRGGLGMGCRGLSLAILATRWLDLRTAEEIYASARASCQPGSLGV